VAILGSLYMMLLTAALSLPIGVAASIYLEEFAPKNRLTDFIEVNIANLAAVPSIVFGILGLAIFINFAELPVSSPLVGALVLTLMTLPTIIIATARACAPCRPRSATPPGRGRLQDADGVPPRPAARHARHPHRHHPGPRQRPGRDGAASC
jgi:hypothetical protein